MPNSKSGFNHVRYTPVVKEVQVPRVYVLGVPITLQSVFGHGTDRTSGTMLENKLWTSF